MDSLDDYQIPYGLMAEFDTPADAMHAAEQVRDFKCYFWVHGFAPYFGIASGVGRFRGPGGRGRTPGRPQGRGTSAAPELTTLPHHILTLTRNSYTVRLKS